MAQRVLSAESELWLTDQEAHLKQLASLTNLSEAEIIRQAIDQRTQSLGIKRRNLAAWESERAFIQQLIDTGPVSDGPAAG